MHRPLARGGSAERRRRSGRRRSTGRWHGGRSATRVYRRRRGCTGGEKEGRQQKGENSGRWHGAGRQGGRGGAPAAGTRRVGGTAEEVRAEKEVHRPRARGRSGGADEPAAKRRDGSRRGKSRPAARMNRQRKGGAAAEEVYRPMARGPVGGADEPATKRSDGGRKEKLRPRARGPAGGTKKACAAAGPYPEVRTTYIIGSVRRGYALQRRESSCRPT